VHKWRSFVQKRRRKGGLIGWTALKHGRKGRHLLRDPCREGKERELRSEGKEEEKGREGEKLISVSFRFSEEKGIIIWARGKKEKLHLSIDPQKREGGSDRLAEIVGHQRRRRNDSIVRWEKPRCFSVFY